MSCSVVALPFTVFTAVLCAFGVLLAFWRSVSWLLPVYCLLAFWRFSEFWRSSLLACFCCLFGGVLAFWSSGVLAFWRWGVFFCFVVFVSASGFLFWGSLSAAFGVLEFWSFGFLFLFFGGWVLGVLLSAFWRSGVFTCVLGVLSPGGSVPIWWILLHAGIRRG